jgi:hypothetical protein
MGEIVYNIFPWVTVVTANLQNLKEKKKKAKHYRQITYRDKFDCIWSAYALSLVIVVSSPAGW